MGTLSRTIFSIVEYEEGANITTENTVRNVPEFFIILEGRVLVRKLELSSGSYITFQLGKGDFFGVVFAMTGLPELESTTALSPLKLISIHRDKFKDLIQKTPQLALKIIRSYSLLLRNLDTIQIETLGGELKDYTGENSLFEFASAYLKTGNKNVASYMLRKYITLNPHGIYIAQAKAKLTNLPKLEERIQNSHEQIRECYPGEIIFCEAEPGNSLYVILEGEVKIIRNSGNSEITINILSPGQIFGEMALLDNKPRSATAIANTNVKLAVINKINFESTTELNPKLMTQIITVLSERVWLLSKKVLNHHIKDINLKIADALYIFYHQFKSANSQNSWFEYPFSPEEFLSMIGLGFKNMENLLVFVSRHKFIKIEKGKIYCISIEELERYLQNQKSLI